jgi:hypothetical protein
MPSFFFVIFFQNNHLKKKLIKTINGNFSKIIKNIYFDISYMNVLEKKRKE